MFNPGERVEGYTNFLWTVLIAGLMWMTPLDGPFLSLIGCLASFVANLLVVCRLGRALHGPTGLYVPLAACLLAVQVVFTSFATTGLETMFASLMVNLGVLFLVLRHDGRGALAAGVFFILATLTRPDHALFYIAAGAAVLVRGAGLVLAAPSGSRRAAWRSGLGLMGAFALPFAAYLVYLAWKLSYYGSLLPNTYYAKSAGLAYWSQGAVYAAVFYLFNHAWALAAILLLWLVVRNDNPTERVFKVFAGTAFVLINGYVMRVGGDYMNGRFYLSLLPLLLLAAERFVYGYRNARRIGRQRVPRVASLVVLVVLLLTAHGLAGTSVMNDNQDRWLVVDASTLNPKKLSQVRLLQQTDWSGPLEQVYRFLIERDIAVASAAVGFVGYDTRLNIIDVDGLCDVHIAHMPVKKRGLIGHEKHATLDYLRQRGARFNLVREPAFSSAPAPYRHFEDLAVVKEVAPWQILIWDRDLMRSMLEHGLQVRFGDFDVFLDEYIANLPEKPTETVRRDLAWFRDFYFAHNDDPERLAALEAHLE